MPAHFVFLPHDAPTPRPGHLLGFSGNDSLSAVINLGSLGWPGVGLSHVAICISHPNGPALVESTTVCDLACIESGETRAGLQCHLLQDRIPGYPGRVWHYPLRRPLTYIDGRELSIRLRAMCREGVPYDYRQAIDSRSTIVAAFMRWKYGHEDLAQLFCSEMVAAEWRSLKILRTANASAWSPNALARYAVRHGLVEEPIEWLPDCGEFPHVLPITSAKISPKE